MEFDQVQPQSVSIEPRRRDDSEQEPELIAEGEWKMTVEEFSFAGCHYNSSCD